MCFAPQRRALFSTSQLPKVSMVCFCIFWLRNVLRATTAFIFFDTSKCSERANVLRATTACNFLSIFLSLIWPDGSAPAALASLLNDPPEPQIIGKNIGLCDFLALRAPGSFFLLRFSLFNFLSSSLLWFFPSLFFHLSILSEIWLLNTLR